MVYFNYKGCDYMNKLLQKYREDLHQIPEIFFKEFKTKKYLKEALSEMGYNPMDILSTGLYVYIDNGNNSTVAFRSDIDALKVTEETGLPFKSTHEGYMHACGHDGHMSMLLGFAHYLKDKKDKLMKNVLLLFQPAEESIGGAKKIVETGIFKKLNVESIFGIHLFPDLEEGLIGSKANEFMAQANEVNITVHGKSAHGAMPELGVDANIILSKILIEFENIQTRMVSPLEYTIITFGKIEGGSVRNVLSDYARMEGTIRVFNPDTFIKISEGIHNICKGYELAYNCKVDVDIQDGYLPVVNDPVLYKVFRNAVSDFNYHEFEKPLMIAEDFSFYQREVPGIFFFVGTKNEKLGYTNSLHNSMFNFTIDALEVGLNSYITLSKKLGVINE